MKTIDILKLDEDDKKHLEELRKLTEDQLLDLLKDLRAERTLEFQIYASREQWLWVPWTTCLAASIVSLTSSFDLIRIGVPSVAGIFAFFMAHRRRQGLLGSFEALNIRHKWVVHITREWTDRPRLKTLGFEDRLAVQKGLPTDNTHIDSFGYPLEARAWTFWVWIGLISVAIGSLFLPSLRPMPPKQTLPPPVNSP